MKSLAMLVGSALLLLLPVPARALDAAVPATSPSLRVQDPKKRPPKPVRVDYSMVKRLFGMDPTVEAVDNPLTPEKVALGKLLYHEPSLSKNGNLSCASCHDLSTYGVDNKPRSPGSDGKEGERNSPTTYNAFRQFAQFWDGRAKNVEEQSTGPMLNAVEHGLADEAELVARLKAKPELVAGFEKAFPGADAVSVHNFRLAVGAFERTLVTKSRFDAYLDGDQKALTNEEKQGLNDFMQVGCITCHTTRLLGGNMFQKSGLLAPYPSEDLGRGKLTGNKADDHFFKVPALLNVEKTAPYYHDGKVATLEEAVTKMAKLQLGKDLTEEQTASIVTFLKALTGPLPEEFAKQ
ncbi:MAG: cytochrome-c peroxidase [Planctomycetes bacterium]|nr:cytochrome-c peroxidase [Planctomycetota bacterium]